MGIAILVSEILLPSETANFPFSTMDYSQWSSKNLINRNQLKKFLKIDADVTCMYTNFGGRSYFGFGDTAAFKTANFPFSTMDYSPWSSKNLIDRNRLKKFLKIDADVTCMYTNFGGRSYFGFGDTSTFKNDQFSLFDHGL